MEYFIKMRNSETITEEFKFKSQQKTAKYKNALNYVVKHAVRFQGFHTAEDKSMTFDFVDDIDENYFLNNGL